MAPFPKEFTLGKKWCRRIPANSHKKKTLLGWKGSVILPLLNIRGALLEKSAPCPVIRGQSSKSVIASQLQKWELAPISYGFMWCKPHFNTYPLIIPTLFSDLGILSTKLFVNQPFSQQLGRYTWPEMNPSLSLHLWVLPQISVTKVSYDPFWFTEEQIKAFYANGRSW